MNSVVISEAHFFVNLMKLLFKWKTDVGGYSRKNRSMHFVACFHSFKSHNFSPNSFFAFTITAYKICPSPFYLPSFFPQN
jgi:hypothetical protein